MNLLFVHQSFPAQYKHIARVLADEGHRVVALRQERGRDLPGVRTIVYTPPPVPAVERRRFAIGYEGAIANATAVLDEARKLKAEGFRPDIMLGHNGWGETLLDYNRRLHWQLRAGLMLVP